MAGSITYIDGSNFAPEAMHDIIMNATEPIVFRNMVTNWKASMWTMETFSRLLFPTLVASFKVTHRNVKCRDDSLWEHDRELNVVDEKKSSLNAEETVVATGIGLIENDGVSIKKQKLDSTIIQSKENEFNKHQNEVDKSSCTGEHKLDSAIPNDSQEHIISTIETNDTTSSVLFMENECEYVDANFDSFHDWLNGQECALFSRFSRASHSLYASYQYMSVLFRNTPLTLLAVDWSVFGFPGRNGEQSTIWIGSEGAYTPCHQDSYGCNLVAQIAGVKRWVLLPPDQDGMNPIRIPYEESSVFSRTDAIALVNDHAKSPGGIDVQLEEGEVLLVPKHWWHFVECVQPSISINTWLEREDDRVDRLKEAIVKTIVCSLKSIEGMNTSDWLNTSQELTTTHENLEFVRSAFTDLVPECGRTFLDADHLVNCMTRDNVLREIVRNMLIGKS